MKRIKISLLISILLIFGSCNNNISTNKDISNEKIVNSDNSSKSVTLSEFKENLTKKDFTLIDIRTISEINDTGIIEGAEQIDFYDKDFLEKLNSLNKEDKIMIYCKSGNRSGQALTIMKNMGFNNVLELKGGIINWIKSGESTVKFLK